MVAVTCRTEGCTDKGIEKPADNRPDPEGAAPSAVICGACGQQITDISPAAGGTA